MQKHIYGLAATFDHFEGEVTRGVSEFSRVNAENIRYGKQIALTVNHNPKQTITTTKNSEKTGELILVQNTNGLFFRFTPSTEEGFRAYRYVKQRRLRQCSCIFYKGQKQRDMLHEERLNAIMPGVLGSDRIYKYSEALLYEICLTSSPKNQSTFCTIDPHHPMLEGIEWVHNIEHSDFDGWSEYVERHELGQEIKKIEEQFKRLDIKINKLKKQRKEMGLTE